MIVNDLQRLRWQILDEALRDPVMEYFMGERTKTNETGNTRSLIHYVNTRLKAVNRSYSCSKRMLQNDVNLFQEKGGRLEPRFRRGHKRILRYINMEWKNPLLRPARSLMAEQEETEAKQSIFAGPLAEGKQTAVTLRITGDTEPLMLLLNNPEVLQRQTDVKSGSTTLTLEVNLSPALQAMLFGLNSIEVLAPESLRDGFRQTLATVQKLYGQPAQPKQKKEEQLSLFDDLF
jgi:hypothetical protein